MSATLGLALGRFYVSWLHISGSISASRFHGILYHQQTFRPSFLDLQSLLAAKSR